MDTFMSFIINLKEQNMRNKKNPSADLERRKPSFFLTGLILAIGGAITIFNLEWTQKSIEVESLGPGEEFAAEIQPKLIKIKPKERKPVAKISDKIIIKDIIEAVVEDPIIKLEDPKDPLDGIEDPDAETEEIFEIEETVEEIVDFVAIEKYPTFSECGDLYDKEEQKVCFERQILKHISANFKYPEQELQMGLEEKVLVQFVITKDGTVDQIEVVRGNMHGFIKESKRLISSLPKVEPAEQRGRPVNLRYLIPIKFKLK